MSSTTQSLSLVQRARDSARIRSLAPSMSQVQQKGTTSQATSYFARKSHTPSEATISMWLVCSSWNFITQGRCDTPTCLTTLSPIERDMASPGKSAFLSQTRSGPTRLPSSSTIFSTRPPLRIILALQDQRCGLCSLEMLDTSHLLLSVLRHRIERESPTLAVQIQVQSSKISERVLPLSEVSMLVFASSACSLSKLRLRALIGIELRQGSSQSSCMQLALMKAETQCPNKPCPSPTPNSDFLPSLPSFGFARQMSWFTFQGQLQILPCLVRKEQESQNLGLAGLRSINYSSARQRLLGKTPIEVLACLVLLVNCKSLISSFISTEFADLSLDLCRRCLCFRLVALLLFGICYIFLLSQDFITFFMQDSVGFLFTRADLWPLFKVLGMLQNNRVEPLWLE